MISSSGADLVRNIFATIDRGVYSLIGVLYNIIEEIAGHELILDSAISNISNKLYSFIGIFMLFKITFSLITYIINPDAMVDKERGGSKLILNIIITFVLIIVTPLGFDLLYEAQSAILNEQVLPRIILSDAPSTGHQLFISSLCEDYGYDIVTPTTKIDINSGEVIDDTGEFIAMITLRPFIQVDSTAIGVRGESAVKKFLNNGYCEASNIKELLKDSIVNFDDSIVKELYIMDYSFLLSTIVGIIVVLIFASFCLDTALRTIKLYFLQIISPVPIMSYIEPGSSKKGLFSKWLKEVGITWADLFLRLAAIYFAIFIISNIQFNDGNVMVNLLLILGTLMFAKKLPDILKKMLNIDVKGDFTLNPFKKFQDNALGGKLIMGSATGLAGGAIGGLTSFRGKDIKERFQNAGKGLKAGLVGGYKNPSTFKGLGSGMAPYREVRKKEKEEIAKARAELDKYDKFNEKGRSLVEGAFKRDSNGNIELDENGKYKVEKNKYFTGEYRDSYNQVGSAKKAVKEADEQLTAAQARFDLIKNRPGMTENNEEYIAALTAQNKAKENLDKKQAELEKAKERHKLVRQSSPENRKQAEIEDAMKEYMDKNPAALEPPRTSSEDGDRTNNVSTTNNTNQTAESNNNPHEQFNELDQFIDSKERELESAKEEYDKYKYTDSPIRNELANDITRIETELQEAKTRKSSLSQEHPEEAIEELQFEIDNSLQPAVEEATNNFNSVDEKLRNLANSGNDEYSLTEEYRQADEQFDQTNAEKNEAESKRDEALNKIEELKRKVRNASEVESESSVQSNSTEQIQNLQSELNQLEKELDEMRRKYGNTYVNTSSSGKELQYEIARLEKEIKILKRQ